MKFEITGDLDGAIDFIEEIQGNVNDSKPAFVSIVDALHQASKRQYDTGSGWTPLKISTIDRKGNSRVLVDTGKLRDAFVRAGSAYSKLNIQDDTISLTTNLLYAGYQFAAGRDPSKIDFTTAENAAVSIYERHVLGGRGLGL